MHLQFDLNTVISFAIVALLGWSAKFLRNLDLRVTRIETILTVKEHVKLNETEN